MENSVGKPAAAREGVAPNVGMGKRDWRTPIPHFRARRSRFGGTGGHVCFPPSLSAFLQFRDNLHGKTAFHFVSEGIMPIIHVANVDADREGMEERIRQFWSMLGKERAH